MAVYGAGGLYPGLILIRGFESWEYNAMVIYSMEIVLFSVALIVFIVFAIIMLHSR